MQAALDGSQEIGFTIVSMTLSLAAVFIPVLFMGGIIGRLLHEFAVTIIVAMLISGFVSLTLTPMLCSRFLSTPQHDGSTAGCTTRSRARASTALLTCYDRRCTWCCAHQRLHDCRLRRHRRSATGVSVRRMPKGFLPERGHRADLRHHRGGAGHLLRRHGRASAGRWPRSSRRTRTSKASCRSSAPAAERVAQHRPHVHRAEAARRARRRADAVIQELRPKLSRSSRHQAPILQNIPADPHRRPAHQEPVPVHAAGHRHRRALQWAPQASRTKLRALPGLSDVTSDLQITSRRSRSRSTATRRRALGVTAQQIESALYNAYGSRQVSTIYAPTNQY